MTKNICTSSSVYRNKLFSLTSAEEQNMQHAKSHLVHYMHIHIAYFKSGLCVLMLILYLCVCMRECACVLCSWF